MKKEFNPRAHSKKERNIQNEIRLALPLNVRAFRNNVGTGWTGDVSRTKSGDIIIQDARPLQAGLCKGSSDLIGWVETVITPEMVGKTVAVFLALEVKTAKGRATKEQKNFIENVQRAGGIAGIVRNIEDAVKLFNEYAR